MKNRDACRPFKDDDFYYEHINERDRVGSKPVLLVERGTCHFVEKAMNAQNFGAVMLIIIDNDSYESPSSIIMADDGTGQKVNIPSFLIGYFDGLKISRAVMEEIEDMLAW